MSARKFTVESAGPKIESFLKNLIKNASLELRFEVTEGGSPLPDLENPDILVKFKGPDIDLLLANKAELLLALEQLTSEMLRMTSEEHSLICFDANDYRIMRMEELRLSAITAAERVKKSRMPFRFNPMNSRERRILHLALRNDSDVRSESAGAGPSRQVVIYPADMPSEPQPPTRPAFRRR